jgi:hypothetical protein
MRKTKHGFYFFASKFCLLLGMRRLGLKYHLLSLDFARHRLKPYANKSFPALNRKVRPRQ